MRTAIVAAALLSLIGANAAEARPKKKARSAKKARKPAKPVPAEPPEPPPEPVAPAPVASPAAPAGTVTPEPEAVVPAASSSASASPDGVVAHAGARTTRAPRQFVIAVEERPFWRRLRYRDDLDARLRPSDLVANAIAVAASYRPLPGLPSFSVQGRGELAVGVNGSRTGDGTAYATSSSEWGLGLGLDIALGSGRLGFAVTYGEQRFSVADDPGMELLPDVTYRFARAGTSYTLPLGSLISLVASGGYRYLFGAGGLTEAAWFPRATGAGMDVSAGLAVHLTPWLDLHARVDARRYFFAMNPEVGDPWISGGATDDYIGGAIGLAVSPP